MNPPAVYARVGSSRGLSTDGFWQTSDHLLVVVTRFFREHYTRLYWRDIQGLTLFERAGFSPAEQWLEILAVLVFVASTIRFHRLSDIAADTVSLALYARWRFRSARFGVMVMTRLSTVRVPLAATRVRSLEIFHALVAKVRLAQNEDAASESAPQTSLRIGPAVFVPQRYSLWLHALLFGVELCCGVGGLAAVELSSIAAVVYIAHIVLMVPLAAVAFIRQRDFEFPIAVKAIALLLQIGLLIGLLETILLRELRVNEPFLESTQIWTFAGESIFSILGLIAVMLYIQRHRNGMVSTSTSLNLS